MQATTFGRHSAADINLDNVPPATSVANPNSLFSARAGAAILYAANLPLPDQGIGNEADYGFEILAKMAYADYFSGPDQVPERSSPSTLRKEVNDSIEKQTAGRVGSSIEELGLLGEYDVLLTAYVQLYYKYYDVLSPNARDKLFHTLLSQRGQYDHTQELSLNGGIFGNVPETENHQLMTQAAKYLTNQLYYQESVAEGRPDHDNFDNNRNGNRDGNPPMVNVILGMLNSYLRTDFVEYNARPYQDYTMTALMNLESYSYDDRVRLAARMVLDYISAKVAVSSQDLRRSPPYRRRNEDQHYGPKGDDGFLRSPLVYNSGTVPGSSPPLPYEPDPQIAFYTLLAGNTRVLEHLEVPPSQPLRRAPGNYAFEMVHAGLSDYRVPPSILDLFVSAKSRNFCQGFHHYAGIDEKANAGEPNSWYVSELYAGSPIEHISTVVKPS
jgi:hypothetical protein